MHRRTTETAMPRTAPSPRTSPRRRTRRAATPFGAALCAFTTLTLLGTATLPAAANAPVATARTASASTQTSTQSPAAAPVVTRDDHPRSEALHAALVGLPDDEATAAVVLAGGRDGRFEGSAGVRDIRSGRAALADGRIRAGSVTKVVNASVVLQLAAENRLSLDSTVQELLPGLLTDDFTQPVTVRNLLNHTSGIQAGAGLNGPWEEQYAHRFDRLPVAEVVRTAVAKGPAFAPGEQQQYLNINYTLLALIVEKVTGHPFEAEATRRVLRPLGMRASYFPGDEVGIRGAHNRGYQLVDGVRVDVTRWRMTDRWAAGDLVSSPADLERLLVGVFTGKAVPRSQLEEMFTVPDIDGATMSAGLERFDLGDGKVVWGKSGARPGYNAGIAATRNLSRTVVYGVTGTTAKESGGPVAARFGIPAFG
ncbi:serine hydrolase domain-containing protein [Streptomyces albidoflavus]|uniref:serine hydrolase domain-containing protein n=1 Tax=Streptomyces albidoflavus TaxID=1886 RepID=UPI0004CC6E09|nr:serine hydrolase domain-containing protein [Streptomyces albidoflavus]